MAGRAFREPSITELFGANTFSLASNPRRLSPEVIRTYETAIDWLINKYVNLRLNLYRTRFENQIAYSLQNNNLSTNLYTLTIGGAESEILVSYNKFSGFFNYSYNKRLGEFIQDKTITKDTKGTTWAPQHTANIGITWSDDKYTYSASVQRQGQTYRRLSDLGPVDPISGLNTNPVPYSVQYPNYRPLVVPAWINVNLRFSYKLNDMIQLGVFAMNAFNSHQELLKNNYYPFDYQRETRRVMFDVNVVF
jgi:iron complex outermembrane receptor protein